MGPKRPNAVQPARRQEKRAVDRGTRAPTWLIVVLLLSTLAAGLSTGALFGYRHAVEELQVVVEEERLFGEYQ